MAKIRKYKDICKNDASPEVLEGKEKNIIPPPEREPLWKGFLGKFKDPLIIALLVAFFFSLVVSFYEFETGRASVTTFIEPFGVLIAILLATGVGFWFEVKASREFDVLNKVKNLRKVKVVRIKNGRCVLITIPKHDVVVGDIVVLESGDEVPADGTLLQANELRVDESIFTGETYADKSTAEPDPQKETAYPSNQLLRSSTVIDGSAVMRVDKIGVDTEEGRGVQLASEESDVKTPLNKQLDHLGMLLSYGSMILGVIIVVGHMTYFVLTNGFYGHNPEYWLEFFEYFIKSIMLALALIVMAVPEGLPMSVTVSLALSMRRMLKENNLVRKLHACETMGAATVICTDKTGTLTENKMKVMQHKFFGSVNIDLMARAVAVNSTATLVVSYPSGTDAEPTIQVIGNPTEGALLKWIREEGYNYEDIRDAVEEINVKAFSSQTKYMQTTLSTGEVFLKGAPEIVLGMSDIIPAETSKESILELLKDYQSKGMRTIGFAYSSNETQGKFVFAAVVAIADPVRKDVPEAINVCSRKAGVRVIMVTGDDELTAREIGRQSGLMDNDATNIAITGKEFAELTDEEARKLIASADFKILSRARPDDKARLVTLLQKNGEVVAVTGDGTNDAPALKKAQVGLSMGDGTSRAKEASDITIIDNSFASINTAILWGRSLYLNIRRFIIYQMTINVAACLVVLYGAMCGLESPLNVTQMLWINLIMDTFAAMALSSLPADKRVMNAPPRSPKSQIIDHTMWNMICGVGVVFAIVLIFLWRIVSVPESDGHYAHNQGYFFTFFVMLQVWNIFNARYYNTGRSLTEDVCHMLFKPSLFFSYYSSLFFLVLIVIIGGQIMIVNLCGEMFGVAKLSAYEWMMIAIYTLPVLLIGEIIRLFPKIFKNRY